MFTNADSILSLPILLAAQVNLYVIGFSSCIDNCNISCNGTWRIHYDYTKHVSQVVEVKSKDTPALLVYNAGMSVNNTVAVFDAVLGKRMNFLEPKYGVLKKKMIGKTMHTIYPSLK